MIERAAARERLVAGAALAGAAALAWLWLATRGSGHDMGGMSGMGAMAPPDVWSTAWLAAAFIMWALMMVAMMLPSAAPMILLYGRAGAHRRTERGLALTSVFALAYIGVWTLFSAAAALAQAALISTGIVDSAALTIGDQSLAGALLILVGLYQLSPLKRSCLDACRSPMSFMLRYARPGAAGALRLGAVHGAYCLGCCWALMLLLFVGGVMNLGWVALLALVVLIEKLTPARLRVTPVLGALLLLAGGAMLSGFVPA